MATTPDVQLLAQHALSTDLNILMSELLNAGLDIGDSTLWRPARRKFLVALIREAQLELANRQPPATKPTPFVTDAGTIGRDGVRRAWCMGSAPHAEHEFSGGDYCPGLTEPAT